MSALFGLSCRGTTARENIIILAMAVVSCASTSAERGALAALNRTAVLACRGRLERWIVLSTQTAREMDQVCAAQDRPKVRERRKHTPQVGI